MMVRTTTTVTDPGRRTVLETDSVMSALPSVGGVGIVTIAVGVGLRNGSRFARILVTILMVIDILGGIANLIWFRNNQTLTSGIITIIVSAVVLVLLYNRRASEFFASTP